MNWYKYAFPLDPGAWNMHDVHHRLPKDQPYVTPYGFKMQPNRSQQELEGDYYGVHTSHSIEVASAYANNISSPNDPPVVLEITTPQGWTNDVDAESFHGLDIGLIKDWLEDAKIKQTIDYEGNSPEVVEDLMQSIRNIDLYDDYNDEVQDSVGDVVLNNNQNKHPSTIVDYFDNYYGEQAPYYFYYNFILPVYYGQGELDDRFMGYMINQMRFMEPIPDEQITAIYVFDRYDDNILDRGYEEEPEEDEQMEADPNQPKRLNREDAYDYYESSINLRKIWENNQPALFNQVFDTYYHGTILSRAKQALPQLANVLNRIG